MILKVISFNTTKQCYNQIVVRIIVSVLLLPSQNSRVHKEIEEVTIL